MTFNFNALAKEGFFCVYYVGIKSNCKLLLSHWEKWKCGTLCLEQFLKLLFLAHCAVVRSG